MIWILFDYFSSPAKHNQPFGKQHCYCRVCRPMCLGSWCICEYYIVVLLDRTYGKALGDKSSVLYHL